MGLFITVTLGVFTGLLLFQWHRTGQLRSGLWRLAKFVMWMVVSLGAGLLAYKLMFDRIGHSWWGVVMAVWAAFVPYSAVQYVREYIEQDRRSWREPRDWP